MKQRLYLLLLCCSMAASSQMIKGYFPYYRSLADVSAVQYTKLTDVIYAFAALDANGNLTITGPGGANDLSLFNPLKANCSSNGVRLWIAIGGWGLSGNFPGVAADPVKRTTLANACRNLCIAHGLAGIDIDWEFPLASDKTNFTAMLAAIKGQLGTTYKLSAALGGESFNYSCVSSGHAVGVEAAAFTHLDFFNIMSYDAPVCFSNHTSLDFMQRAMMGWNALGCPYSKMIPGMAFYSRGTMVEMWKNFASTTRFNDADGIDGGLHFDSKPTIQAKTNWAMCTMGAPGIMTWELSQDLPGSNALNLTSAMYDAVMACACPFSDPSLGADQSLCGTAGSITLSPGIATNAPSRTFTWKKDGSTVVNASTSANTYVANSAGTYEVIVTEGTCSKSDVIIITATLPTPNLGPDKALCSPSHFTLIPSNLASFPPSTLWSWSKDGTSLGILNSQISFVRSSGTYRLTANISGCSSTFDEVIITSTQPIPVDACISVPGPVSLSIANTGAGPYAWYANATGGTALASGVSYAPTVSSTDTFWVQEGTGASYYVGPTGTPSGWDGPGSITEGLNFTVSTNTITLVEVDVYVPIWTDVTNVFVEILNASGSTTLFTGPSLSYSNQTNAVTKVIVPVGASLAPGTYRLVVRSTGNLKHGVGGTFPYSVNDVSITSMFGVASWPFAYNWKIGGSSACARLGVLAQVGGCSVPAPVQYLDFSLSKESDRVHLQWTTAQEHQNLYFEVQRSADGIEFYTIGRVEGAFHSNEARTYAFTDKEPLAGISYYRLAQRDQDGSIHYSGLLSLINVNAIRVYPNPAAHGFYVSADRLEGARYRVSNALGQLQETGVFNSSEGWMGEQWEPGMYHLEVQLGDRVFRHVILKQ